MIRYVFFDERVILSGNAFDGLDAFAVAFYGKGRAREYRPPVHDHGARSADAPVAHELGAGEAEPVMDHVIEGPFRLDLHFEGLSVDRKGYGSRRFRKRLSAML
jgi:hypothetical protein